MEIEWTHIDYSDRNSIPEAAGVYLIKVLNDKEEIFLYVGKSINLKRRLSSHLPFVRHVSKRLEDGDNLIVCYHVTEKIKETEIYFIKKYKPEYNRQYLPQPCKY